MIKSKFSVLEATCGLHGQPHLSVSGVRCRQIVPIVGCYQQIRQDLMNAPATARLTTTQAALWSLYWGPSVVKQDPCFSFTCYLFLVFVWGRWGWPWNVLFILGWPQTHDPPALATRVLELQMSTTMLSFKIRFLKCPFKTYLGILVGYLASCVPFSVLCK